MGVCPAVCDSGSPRRVDKGISHGRPEVLSWDVRECAHKSRLQTMMFACGSDIGEDADVKGPTKRCDEAHRGQGGEWHSERDRRQR